MDWEAFTMGPRREGAPGFVMQKEGRRPHTPSTLPPPAPVSGPTGPGLVAGGGPSALESDLPSCGRKGSKVMGSKVIGGGAR